MLFSESDGGLLEASCQRVIPTVQIPEDGDCCNDLYDFYVRVVSAHLSYLFVSDRVGNLAGAMSDTKSGPLRLIEQFACFEPPDRFDLVRGDTALLSDVRGVCLAVAAAGSGTSDEHDHLLEALVNGAGPMTAAFSSAKRRMISGR